MNHFPSLTTLDADVTVSSSTGSSQVRDIEFTVQLSAPVSGDVSVDYQAVSGTALAHADFVATRGTLTIAGGETTGQIVVRAWGNGSEQPDKDMTLVLSNLSGAAFAGGGLTAQARGVILDPYDSDTRPSLFVSDPVLVEGNAGTREAVFDIRLSRPADADITLNYSTVDGNATAGNDYQSRSGSVTFLAGQTVASVAVPVIGDTAIEPTERFSLVFAPDARLANGTEGLAGVATILDDDAGGGTLPVVTVLDGAVLASSSTGSSQVRDIEFTVQLSAPVSGDVSVDYQAVSGTALAHADFVATRGTLTIAGGETTGQIVVRAWGNGSEQPDKDMTLVLSNLSGAAFAGGGLTAQARGVILDPYDSDTRPSLFVSDPVLVEGNAGTREAVFDIRLSRPADADITLNYSTSPLGASTASDFMPVFGSLTLAAGQTVASVAVPVTGDTAIEPTEQFRLVVAAEDPSALALGGGGVAGIGTILDDDAGGGNLPVVSVLDTEVLVSGSGSSSGRRDVEFTVQLSAPAPGDVTLNFRTLDGTAVAGADYVAREGVLTISAGQTTGTITASAQGNGSTQLHKTFGLELSNIDGAVLAGATSTIAATATLIDPTPDPTAGLPTLGVENIVLEQPETGQENAQFLVSVPTPAGLNIRGDFEILAGTAVAGEDFVAQSGSFTISSGNFSAAIPLTVLSNPDRGDDSTVILRLSDITNAQLPLNADEGFGIAVLEATGVTPEPVEGLEAVIIGGDGGPLADTTVLFTPDGAESPAIEAQNGPDGRVTLTIDDGIGGHLDATRDYDPARDDSLTAGDALDVLRLAVGLPPGWGTASPLNFVAADINQDGQVTAGDALDVLRAAVGLQSVNQPRWIFLDDDADLSNIDRSNTQVDTGVRIDPLAAGLTEVTMTGVLLGNMQEYA
ncbi:Calx-beta domain-containing protein [Roseovarius sp.]|uniref:Calx-beta domain-containing protein n=1 Tax=Roseovarius sp. TaxID=1486281 RepID=UPI003569FFD8